MEKLANASDAVVALVALLGFIGVVIGACVAAAIARFRVALLKELDDKYMPRNECELLHPRIKRVVVKLEEP